LRACLAFIAASAADPGYLATRDSRGRGTFDEFEAVVGPVVEDCGHKGLPVDVMMSPTIGWRVAGDVGRLVGLTAHVVLDLGDPTLVQSTLRSVQEFFPRGGPHPPPAHALQTELEGTVRE